MEIYDENDNCVECSEYIYDLHNPKCKYKSHCGLCDCGWRIYSQSLNIHSTIVREERIS